MIRIYLLNAPLRICLSLLLPLAVEFKSIGVGWSSLLSAFLEIASRNLFRKYLGLASLVSQMVKNPPGMWETWVRSLGWEDPLEEGRQRTSLFLPGESHRQRSLAGCSPWGLKESDTTEGLSTAQCKLGFPAAVSGKEPACQCRTHERHGFDHSVGKIPWRRAGNALHYSCLENPIDRGAWRAAVRGVAKSQTRPQRLSTHA